MKHHEFLQYYEVTQRNETSLISPKLWKHPTWWKTISLVSLVLSQGKCCVAHDFDHVLSVVVYMNLISFLGFYQIHQQPKKKKKKELSFWKPQQKCEWWWGWWSLLFLDSGWALNWFSSVFVLQKTLEAFIIILAFFQLLYLLSLHAGILGSNYGPTYEAAAPGTGVGPKTPNVGTPAASAV